MNTATQPKTCDTSALDSLLRGEMSAVETYDKGLEKFRDDPTFSSFTSGLAHFRDEHQSTVIALRRRIVELGGTPSEGSGVWGAFANFIAGTAKIVGPQSVLAALKQGEKQGIADYQSTLEGGKLLTECNDMIRSEFLPKCEKHVVKLDQMISTIAAS